MDHEIYLTLVDLQEKISYMHNLLIEKGIAPNPEEKEEGTKVKEDE